MNAVLLQQVLETARYHGRTVDGAAHFITMNLPDLPHQSITVTKTDAAYLTINFDKDQKVWYDEACAALSSRFDNIPPIPYSSENCDSLAFPGHFNGTRFVITLMYWRLS